MVFSLPFFKPSPSALVRQLKDLPPTPAVLHKLQRLVASPDSTLEQIVEVVQLEQGLTARVMRMAQSAHFSRGVPSASIFEAVQRVGLAGVHELVTYAVAAQIVGQPLRAYQLEAQSLWSRAVACAIAAASLAEWSEVDRSDAYTAGLMHGVGLMVIDRYATVKQRREPLVSAGYPVDFAPAEREWLGYSHAETGAALLEVWGFSAPVIAAVAHQLEPEKAADHRQLAMVLATARWARSLFCVPEEKIPELPSAQWLDESGVKIGDFGEWLGMIRRRYDLARSELRLK